jgi:hypothetical protein
VTHHRIRRLAVGVFCVTALVWTRALAQTQALQPQASELATRFAALSASGGTVMAIVPLQSQIRIYAFRAGRAAQLGHNHVLSVAGLEGYLYLPDAGMASGQFELAFRLNQMEVDRSELREAVGSNFGGALSDSARSGTRDNMLGEFGLQAERFPWVRIRSLEIAGEAPKFAVRVAIELHGQILEQWVPLQVNGLPGSAIVQGSAVVRQTDFGIQPFSVLGGLLAVQDPLVVEFQLQAHPVAATSAVR